MHAAAKKKKNCVEVWSDSQKEWLSAELTFSVMIFYNTNNGPCRKSMNLQEASSCLRYQRSKKPVSLVIAYGDFSEAETLTSQKASEFSAGLDATLFSAMEDLHISPVRSGGSLRARSLTAFFHSYANPEHLGIPRCLSAVPRQELFEHERSGIICCAPFRLAENQNESMVLYHYTRKEAFYEIQESKEIWATLWKHKQQMTVKDTGFGDGVYTTSLSPEDFMSKEAVLINNYTDQADLNMQRQAIQDYAGLADCCIPLIVDKAQISDVIKCGIPELGVKPGFNRHGDAVRLDRDVWVIKHKDPQGNVRHVRANVEHVLNRLNTATNVRALCDALNDLRPLADKGCVQALEALARHAYESHRTLSKDVAKHHILELVQCSVSRGRPEVRHSMRQYLQEWRQHDASVWEAFFACDNDESVLFALAALSEVTNPGDISADTLQQIAKQLENSDSSWPSRFFLLKLVIPLVTLAKNTNCSALQVLSKRFLEDKDNSWFFKCWAAQFSRDVVREKVDMFEELLCEELGLSQKQQKTVRELGLFEELRLSRGISAKQ